MEVSNLTFEQLHGKLRAIKDLPRKRFHKYPDEVAPLVLAAFARGMNVPQIEALSGVPDQTLRSFKRKCRDRKASAPIEREVAKPRKKKGFVTIAVEHAVIPERKGFSGPMARVTLGSEGLWIELGIESLTPDLLRLLRSFG